MIERKELIKQRERRLEMLLWNFSEKTPQVQEARLDLKLAKQCD